jgi:hypothetical protein
VLNLAVAVVCAALGLVALPFTFNSPLLSASAWARPGWLLAAALISVALLTLVPRLAKPLGKHVERQAPGATPSQSRLVAQLLVLAIILVLVQAILRRPLALVLAQQQPSTTYEEAIAATGLTVILALLVWLYQSGRPLLQSITLRVIDAAIPTVEAAPVAEPTRTTISSIVTAPTLRAPSDADEPTIRASDAERTVITRRKAMDPDATLAADPDATLRGSEPGT